MGYGGNEGVLFEAEGEGFLVRVLTDDGAWSGPSDATLTSSSLQMSNERRALLCVMAFTIITTWCSLLLVQEVICHSHQECSGCHCVASEAPISIV